jgi:hypothetical protein
MSIDEISEKLRIIIRERKRFREGNEEVLKKVEER